MVQLLDGSSDWLRDDMSENCGSISCRSLIPNLEEYEAPRAKKSRRTQNVEPTRQIQDPIPSSRVVLQSSSVPSSKSSLNRKKRKKNPNPSDVTVPSGALIPLPEKIVDDGLHSHAKMVLPISNLDSSRKPKGHTRYVCLLFSCPKCTTKRYISEMRGMEKHLWNLMIDHKAIRADWERRGLYCILSKVGIKRIDFTVEELLFVMVEQYRLHTLHNSNIKYEMSVKLTGSCGPMSLRAQRTHPYVTTFHFTFPDQHKHERLMIHDPDMKLTIRHPQSNSTTDIAKFHDMCLFVRNNLVSSMGEMRGEEQSFSLGFDLSRRTVPVEYTKKHPWIIPKMDLLFNGASCKELINILVTASEGEQTDIVPLLLQDLRIDPSPNDNYAFRIAAESGQTDIVQLLLQGPRIDPSSRDNKAFRTAAENGQTSHSCFCKIHASILLLRTTGVSSISSAGIHEILPLFVNSECAKQLDHFTLDDIKNLSLNDP
ncbi:hypothetical protein PROFUN_14079 [Planoprotostelium fungivorum]|uniref:Ankyrin repeat protein n=1 Tax=Planoprotostelium fungivorum TaxID=1890364 RepID=A0A2P6N229_9EUKA|nr:hypothetical protein PROFUN_14079 [Planoprotostelium fungivorum]